MLQLIPHTLDEVYSSLNIKDSLMQTTKDLVVLKTMKRFPVSQPAERKKKLNKAQKHA